MSEARRIVRIAVSGGPGAGKTTVWRALAAELGARVATVPEVATLMFAHVFPGVRSEAERRSVQEAIFAVQRSLEAFHATRSEGLPLLCDRGTPDGGGYWPEGPDDFFATLGTSWEAELARYDAVLFLETAAAGGLAVAGGNNRTRTEDRATAVEVDRRLREVWRRHPRFVFVGHEPRFEDKVARASETLRALLGRSAG